MSEDTTSRAAPRLTAAQSAHIYAPLRAAALDLFETKTFEATTAEDIALAAGISRRTFFRYFPVREDVLFSDHAGYLLAVEERLQVSTGEPIRVAGGALTSVIEGHLLDTDFVIRRAAVVRANRALHDREVLWMREYQQLLGAYLSRQHLGQRSAIFAQIVAAALLAALTQVLDRWVQSPATEDPRGLFAELLDEVAESMADSGPRGAAPAPGHPERPGIVVINSGLSANEIAALIEGAQP
ncbi:TetR family transcriptional regulator [Subtercola sp. YIM 133946]|uniref:TetR family transcriptional regulator n=1 Tax=Subtercola sp. YIM 133946 TaxID=3118909 RepID=UPI002F94B3BE